MKRLLKIDVEFEIPQEVSREDAREYIADKMPGLLNNLRNGAGNKLRYLSVDFDIKP